VGAQKLKIQILEKGERRYRRGSFLNDVAELPSDLRPRLLRVLQERQFSPVGSSKLVYC
jgi:DNA-binding NtrC family response regulator